MANARGRQQQAADGKDSRGLVENFEPSSAWSEDSDFHYLLIDLPGFKKEWLRLNVDDHGHVLVTGERLVSENKIIRFEQTFIVPKNSDLEKITGRFEGEILYVILPKQAKKEEGEHHKKHEQAKREEEGDKRTARGVEEKHEHAKKEEGDKGTASGVKEKHEHAKKEEGGDKGTASGVKEKHEHAKKEEGDKGTTNGVEKKHEHEEQHGDGHSHHHENDEDGGMSQEEGFQETNRETGRQEAGLLGSVVEILCRNKGIVTTAVLAFSLGVLVSQKFQSNIGTEVFHQYNHSF